MSDSSELFPGDYDLLSLDEVDTIIRGTSLQGPQADPSFGMAARVRALNEQPSDEGYYVLGDDGQPLFVPREEGIIDITD